MSNNIKFDLLSLVEAIDKIELYSQSFSNADNFYHDQKSCDASKSKNIYLTKSSQLITLI